MNLGNFATRAHAGHVNDRVVAHRASVSNRYLYVVTILVTRSGDIFWVYCMVKDALKIVNNKHAFVINMYAEMNKKKKY